MFGLSKTESVRCLRWQPTTPKSRGNRRRPHKNYKQPWNSFNYNWTKDLIFVPEYFFFPQFNNVGHFLHSKLTAHNFMWKKRTLCVFYLLLVQPLALSYLVHFKIFNLVGFALQCNKVDNSVTRRKVQSCMGIFNAHNRRNP